MSAWYILNTMGIYPICPGDDRYSIGRPSFDQIELNLENGKVFTVVAENRSETNAYVQSVHLNGEKLTEPYIHHADIESGATLTFVMGAEKILFWE